MLPALRDSRIYKKINIFQSSFRAVSELFKVFFKLSVERLVQLGFNLCSEQFQSSFRVVSEQFELFKNIF